MRRFVWLGLGLMLGCEGAGGTGGTDATSDGDGRDTTGGGCRSDNQCGDNHYCRGAVLPDNPVCGIPCRGEKTCAQDGDCESGACLEFVGNCCRDGDETSTSCQPPCTIDSACGKDRRCTADQRACEAIPCDDGFTCPAETRCDRGSAASQARLVDPLFSPVRYHELDHGCVRITCATDGDCDAGVCVSGLCQEVAGICTEIVIVP